jgi:hypothetical protein
MEDVAKITKLQKRVDLITELVDIRKELSIINGSAYQIVFWYLGLIIRSLLLIVECLLTQIEE